MSETAHALPAGEEVQGPRQTGRPESRESVSSIGRGRVLRVLYAEDEPADAELCLGQLEAAGYQVRADVVSNREEFAACLRSGGYDIVLADYKMPGWSGGEALETLQREGSEIPLLVVTGAVGDEAAAAMIKKGAADYILKDRPARLASAVERALEEKAIQRERQRAEDSLRASEIRYRRLFETAQDGILLLTGAGVITDANPFLLERLGFSRSEIVGQRLCEVGLAAEHEECQKIFHQLQQGEDTFCDSLPVLTHSGRRLEVEFASKAYQAGDEKVIQCHLRDISERKRLEEALKLTLRMREDFINFAMHQLRTPLAGIKWLLELAARRQDLPAEPLEFVHDAHAAAQGLISMVNDLLSIRRLENGKLNLELQPGSLGELTRSVLEEVSHQIAERGHHLSVTGAEEVPAIRTDLQLLRQVISNLVSNAVKYTDPGGRIQIEMKSRDGLVCWSIRDNGVGIPQEVQQRIFEKFFRADNIQRLDTEGSGLGLCLARLIVERLGGTLSFESQEGQGSIFTVTVPQVGGETGKATPCSPGAE